MVEYLLNLQNEEAKGHILMWKVHAKFYHIDSDG